MLRATQDSSLHSSLVTQATNISLLYDGIYHDLGFHSFETGSFEIMTTLTNALDFQKSDHILYAPTIEPSTNATGTLSISLYNATTSNNVYAYITGLAINKNNAVFLLQSDGQTAYYPDNPSSDQIPLSADCAIALGAVGTTKTVTVPYIAGGRIWFCIDGTLTFLLNNGQLGPGLVEPSVSNAADPNHSLNWDFCEFTYNQSQLYANITYVDFVSIPIALTLTGASGSVSHVGGLPANGLDTICSNLIAQNNLDGAGWDQLIITNNGTQVRVLSPDKGIIMNSSLFENYWTDYINQVWAKYVSTPLVIDTQSSWGTVTGYTSNDRTQLTFSGFGGFSKPSAQDIFGADSGPFAPQLAPAPTAALLNIGARLDAAFNRATLLTDSNQPDGEIASNFYTDTVTNHYSRIVHAANVDGRGYCFPYDDVTPSGGPEQSGYVADPAPANFLVTVGGGNAYVRSKRSVDPIPKMMKRSIRWEEDVMETSGAEKDLERDLEKGEHPKLLSEMDIAEPSSALSLPPALDRIFGKYLAVSPLPFPIAFTSHSHP